MALVIHYLLFLVTPAFSCDTILMMKTGIEISNDGPKDFGSTGTIQELRNGGTLCTRKLQNNPGNDQQHTVDSCEEELPSPPDQPVKKRRDDGSTECLFGRLPVDILHDILSRLSIVQLLNAARTCLAWRRMVSSCKLFQRFYDQRNEESWIVRCRPSPCNFDEFWFLNFNSKRWSLLRATPPAPVWFLHADADGLLLLLSEGKLAVANPLTKKIRALPDTQVTSRLSLDECLRKRVWSCRTTTTTPRIHLSLHTVVDPTDHQKSFKVIVWGELRTRQIHLLVYNSATDSWSSKLCSEVDYRFFKPPVFFTVDGSHTIYVTSPYRSPSVVASYNTDTGLFVVNEPTILQLRDWFFPMVADRVQIIGIMAYRTQILLLAVVAGDYRGQPLAVLGLWQGNPTGGQWQLFTAKRLTYPSLEIVAAYVGNGSMTIIQGMRLVITLDLHSKEWTETSSNSTFLGTTSGDPVWGHHMKLRLSTALSTN